MKASPIFQAALCMALAIIATSCCGAAAEDTSCVSQLLPCLSYLNGTGDPPDSCCKPLKWVVNESPKCLCSLISIKGARQAQRAGINTDEAQQLPGRCGLRVNPIACVTGSSSSVSSGAAAMTPSSSMLGFLTSVAIFGLLGTIRNHLV